MDHPQDPASAPAVVGAGPAGVFLGLAGLPDDAWLTEAALAALLGRCVRTIKNAVRRRELPRPVRTLGKPQWTAGALKQHMNARLDAERRKQERHGI